MKKKFFLSLFLFLLIQCAVFAKRLRGYMDISTGEAYTQSNETTCFQPVLPVSGRRGTPSGAGPAAGLDS